uniref:Brf1 TBP-binding domain-containing protein n=1 Tax=Grammatophora oceanica TaxID=210454 RepID=A0A7S1YNE0_9STRA
MQESTQPNVDKLHLDSWKKEMPQSHMDEIDGLFRDEEEMAQKEAIFNALNKDYLLQVERKESVRQQQEAAMKDKEEDELAQAEGAARYLNRRGTKGQKRQKAQTTEEALMEAVSNRKISRKINYDAMSAIFDDEGGFSTDLGNAGEVEDAGTEEAEFAMV